MAKSRHILQKSYFDLAEHNTKQVLVFLILVTFFIITLFLATIPFMEYVFITLLNGSVINDGSYTQYLLESPEPLEKTSLFTAWAVDVYVGTPQQARYWFNPFLSLFLPTVVISLMVTVIIGSLLPQNLGLFRQKIEREIAHVLDKIALKKYGFHADEGRDELINDIMGADLRDLHDYVDLWRIPLEDLKTLHKALKWSEAGPGYKILHINDGISMYMRFYFTRRYNNAILGLVYMGAAVLIIIIGLRGLKFIPATQPSLVFFALGLEFSLLIIYAFTLIYAREDDEEQPEASSAESTSLLVNSDLGNSREIEQLLRVFIKSQGKEKKD